MTEHKLDNLSNINLSLTRKNSLNSNADGNCVITWWTASNHWKNTGLLSLPSFSVLWPHRSANLCPNSNHSRPTNTWNPWENEKKKFNV